MGRRENVEDLIAKLQRNNEELQAAQSQAGFGNPVTITYDLANRLTSGVSDILGNLNPRVLDAIAPKGE
jgi:2-keto-4-pentenoate hydratase